MVLRGMMFSCSEHTIPFKSSLTFGLESRSNTVTAVERELRSKRSTLRVQFVDLNLIWLEYVRKFDLRDAFLEGWGNARKDSF